MWLVYIGHMEGGRPFRQIQISGCFYTSCEVKKTYHCKRDTVFFRLQEVPPSIVESDANGPTPG